MSPEYSYNEFAKSNGIVYRSRTESRWSSLFDDLRIRYDYEPTTFVFPNGTRYSPDFYIRSFNQTLINRYVEVKSGNITAEACTKVNDLARHLDRHTLLLDGSPKDASAYVFDGRPPQQGWDSYPAPINKIAYDRHYGHNAGLVINLLLQPNHYEPMVPVLPKWLATNRVVKEIERGISYDISDVEKEELRVKLNNPDQEVIIFSAETSDMQTRYISAPLSRIESNEYYALDKVNNADGDVF